MYKGSQWAEHIIKEKLSNIIINNLIIKIRMENFYARMQS